MWICQTCLHDRVKSRRSGRVTAEAALCFQWVVSEAHDVHSVGEVDFNLSLKNTISFRSRWVFVAACGRSSPGASLVEPGLSLHEPQ